jgi:hypothetical protein
MTQDEKVARRIAAEAKTLGVIEISETVWRMANAVLANGEEPLAPIEEVFERGGPEPMDAGATPERGGVTIGDEWTTIRERMG